MSKSLSNHWWIIKIRYKVIYDYHNEELKTMTLKIKRVILRWTKTLSKVNKHVLSRQVVSKWQFNWHYHVFCLQTRIFSFKEFYNFLPDYNFLIYHKIYFQWFLFFNSLSWLSYCPRSVICLLLLIISNVNDKTYLKYTDFLITNWIFWILTENLAVS